MFGRLVIEQAVEVRRRQAFDERREAPRHVDQPRAAIVRASPRSASSYPYAPSPHDDSDGRRREHRMAPLRLARVDVRQVHLDERHADRDQRIANRQARVRVRAGVDHDAVDAAAQACEWRRSISLRRCAARTPALRRCSCPTARSERSMSASDSRPYSAGSRRPEQVQIRSVEDGDLHVFFSPFSQALNCAMSSNGSLGAALGSPEPGADSPGVPSPKN